jgi:hypothetical protein
MSERLMTPADLEQVTGYKRYSAQVRWFKQQFGADVPRRTDGSIVLLWATFLAMEARKYGLLPADPASVPREKPPVYPLKRK